jgi:hypothetical protein
MTMVLAVSTAFWFSYALLWLVVVIFGLLIILMYRQFGLAFMRPVERAGMQGLDVGSKAPSFALTDARQREITIDFPRDADVESTLLIFGLPTCQICSGLAKGLASLPRDWPGVRFVWVDGFAIPPGHLEIGAGSGWIAGTQSGDPVHTQWAVSTVPFCFIVDEKGRIASKQLLNHRSDVELALGAASS